MSTTPVPGVDPLAGGYYIWRYNPNKGAAAFFLVLFLATTAYNSWRMYRARAWFCSVFVIGGLLEIIGYAARTACHNNTGVLMPYIIQNVTILIAPALFAASVYMTLGRIITAVAGEKYAWIRPSRLTKIFVAGDVISFMIQAGGAGIMSSGDPGKVKWGERSIIIGLVVQIVVFGLFGVVAWMFHRKLNLAPTQESWETDVPWRRCMGLLYAVSGLIMVRSLFRVIEYAMGHEGYLLSHEWTLYVFDGLLMFVVAAIFDIRSYTGPPRRNPVELLNHP